MMNYSKNDEFSKRISISFKNKKYEEFKPLAINSSCGFFSKTAA
jgi:hypothetical protein